MGGATTFSLPLGSQHLLEEVRIGDIDAGGHRSLPLLLRHIAPAGQVRMWTVMTVPPAQLIGSGGVERPRLPPSQWRSARTTNAIERLHEEFKQRIKTQTVLP
jgi:hypothetical protein